MAVQIKEIPVVSLEQAFDDLNHLVNAMGTIATYSNTIALEAIDVGKIKDAVVNAFKAFWERLVALYKRFVAWIKGKKTSKEMHDEVDTVKEDLNKTTTPEVKAAAKTEPVYNNPKTDRRLTTDDFITSINLMVKRELPKGGDHVLNELKRIQAEVDGKQAKVVGCIYNYYRALFVVEGKGDNLIGTRELDALSALIDNDLSGARIAFFQFIKLPAGDNLEELARKIYTFQRLPVFTNIVKHLSTFISIESGDDSSLMVLDRLLPQVKRITETDFSKVRSVSKNLEIEPGVISYTADNAKVLLDTTESTIDAYKAICDIIEEQADEFQNLRPEVVVPGSTLAEIKPYVDTVTVFSRVQNVLARLMSNKYHADISRVKSIIALRDALRDNLK